MSRLRQLDTPRTNPAWGEKGTEGRIRDWKPFLDKGGVLLGSFDSDRLAGFVILGPAKRDRSAEVVALFIDRDYRRRGIGAELMSRIEQKALARGIETLYLYSNPTVSSASFYLKTGFQITGLVSKQIVRSLSGDIIMAKRIAE